MKLKLNEIQFEVLWTLVRNVRLGTGSIYSKATFGLLEQMERKAEKLGTSEESLPELSVEFDEDGLTIELN